MFSEGDLVINNLWEDNEVIIFRGTEVDHLLENTELIL